MPHSQLQMTPRPLLTISTSDFTPSPRALILPFSFGCGVVQMPPRVIAARRRRLQSKERDGLAFVAMITMIITPQQPFYHPSSTVGKVGCVKLEYSIWDYMVTLTVLMNIQRLFRAVFFFESNGKWKRRKSSPASQLILNKGTKKNMQISAKALIKMNLITHLKG